MKVLKIKSKDKNDIRTNFDIMLNAEMRIGVRTRRPFLFSSLHTIVSWMTAPEKCPPLLVWGSPTQANPETGRGGCNAGTLHLQSHTLCVEQYMHNNQDAVFYYLLSCTTLKSTCA